MIISKDNINVLDVSKIKSGMYNLQIMYKNKNEWTSNELKQRL